MKKKLLIIFLSVAAIFNVAASKSTFFKYDKEQLSKELSTLNSVEQYIKTNDVTYSQLLNNNKDLASVLSFKDVYNLSLAEAEPPLGIPSFWWGCIFGVAGILVVYLITEDKSEVMKAFKGCVVGTLISLVLYLIYVAALAGTAASTI